VTRDKSEMELYSYFVKTLRTWAHDLALTSHTRWLQLFECLHYSTLVEYVMLPWSHNFKC